MGVEGDTEERVRGGMAREMQRWAEQGEGEEERGEGEQKEGKVKVGGKISMDDYRS